jgi:hypothetical protein
MGIRAKGSALRCQYSDTMNSPWRAGIAYRIAKVGQLASRSSVRIENVVCDILKLAICGEHQPHAGLLIKDVNGDAVIHRVVAAGQSYLLEERFEFLCHPADPQPPLRRARRNSTRSRSSSHAISPGRRDPYDEPPRQIRSCRGGGRHRDKLPFGQRDNFLPKINNIVLIIC